MLYCRVCERASHFKRKLFEKNIKCKLIKFIYLEKKNKLKKALSIYIHIYMGLCVSRELEIQQCLSIKNPTEENP